jgi:hypothetical protein
MWQTFQQESFLFGAALVLIYQAAKFGELNLADPIAGRYIAFLPGAKVRDFAGRYDYNFARAAFLGVSFIAYFLICQISPDLLAGASKLFVADFDAAKAMQGIPFPLYVAALFMGLTQPIIPGLSRLEDAQRTFFHDQIAVPGRVVDISENLTNAIEARAGEDRQKLADEIRKLAGNAFQKSLQPYGDIPFYRAQLDKLEISNGELEATIRDSSVKELHLLIERLVMYAHVAVMRKSGPKSLAEVARSLDAPVTVQPGGGFRAFLTSLIAIGVPFCLGLLTIAFVLLWFGTPINSLFSKSADLSLWPSTLDYVVEELSAIVPPIVACMILAVAMLVPRQTQEQAADTSSAAEAGSLLDFFQANASVFGLCMLTAIVIKVGQMFREFGTYLQPGGEHSASLLMLPVIQSLIAVAVCLFTTWYLVASARGVPRHGPSFLVTMLLIAGSTGFVALLYDLTFLEQYLQQSPKYGPGREHVLFSIAANVLVSLCAFASVALLFKARGRPVPAG